MLCSPHDAPKSADQPQYGAPQPGYPAPPPMQQGYPMQQQPGYPQYQPQVVQQVIVVQTGAPMSMNNWHSECGDLCAEPGGPLLCLYVCLFPCCAAGDIAEAAGRSYICSCLIAPVLSHVRRLSRPAAAPATAAPHPCTPPLVAAAFSPRPVLD